MPSNVGPYPYTPERWRDTIAGVCTRRGFSELAVFELADMGGFLAPGNPLVQIHTKTFSESGGTDRGWWVAELILSADLLDSAGIERMVHVIRITAERAGPTYGEIATNPRRLLQILKG
jgi:hypothetical protein